MCAVCSDLSGKFFFKPHHANAFYSETVHFSTFEGNMKNSNYHLEAKGFFGDHWKIPLDR